MILEFYLDLPDSRNWAVMCWAVHEQLQVFHLGHPCLMKAAERTTFISSFYEDQS